MSWHTFLSDKITSKGPGNSFFSPTGFIVHNFRNGPTSLGKVSSLRKTRRGWGVSLKEKYHNRSERFSRSSFIVGEG